MEEVIWNLEFEMNTDGVPFHFVSLDNNDGKLPNLPEILDYEVTMKNISDLGSIINAIYRPVDVVYADDSVITRYDISFVDREDIYKLLEKINSLKELEKENNKTKQNIEELKKKLGSSEIWFSGGQLMADCPACNSNAEINIVEDYIVCGLCGYDERKDQ